MDSSASSSPLSSALSSNQFDEDMNCLAHPFPPPHSQIFSSLTRLPPEIPSSPSPPSPSAGKAQDSHPLPVSCPAEAAHETVSDAVPPRTEAPVTTSSMSADPSPRLPDRKPPPPGMPPSPSPPPLPSSPPVTVSRSGRRIARKRSSSFGEEAPRPAKSPSESAITLRRKREAARWQPEFVLSNAKSPLANYDIRSLLCNPQAWQALTPEDQREVLLLFPSGRHIVDADTDQARPDIASLKNDDSFRHDCARYQNDLRTGFHDKKWLAEAYAAHELRKSGIFDQFIAETFEREWNIQLPEAYRPAYSRPVDSLTDQSGQHGQPGQPDRPESTTAREQDQTTDGRETMADTAVSTEVEMHGAADNLLSPVSKTVGESEAKPTGGSEPVNGGDGECDKMGDSIEVSVR